MSFNPADVAGLDLDVANLTTALAYLVDYEPGSIFICVGSFVSNDCESCASGAKSYVLDPRDAVHTLTGAPLDPDADYYRVGVIIDGPSLNGGWFGCDNGTCAGPDEPTYDGVVSGTYRRISGASVAPTFHADAGGGGGNAARAHTRWPNPARNEAAYHVNPAPPLPVPDVNGNEFTQCLFTYAQLPLVSLDVTHYNFGQPGNQSSFFSLVVGAYYGEGTVVAPVQQTHVVDSA